MLSTVIGYSVSVPLDAVSLAGTSVSGMATALTKKYQRKLGKGTKLTDILTSALAVFETSVSKALKDSKTDEQEFNRFQALYYKSFNNLSNFNHKMEVENRNQLEKSLLKEINNLTKKLRKRDAK